MGDETKQKPNVDKSYLFSAIDPILNVFRRSYPLVTCPILTHLKTCRKLVICPMGHTVLPNGMTHARPKLPLSHFKLSASHHFFYLLDANPPCIATSINGYLYFSAFLNQKLLCLTARKRSKT